MHGLREMEWIGSADVKGRQSNQQQLPIQFTLGNNGISGSLVEAGQKGADGHHQNRLLGRVKGMLVGFHGIKDGVGEAVSP